MRNSISMSAAIVSALLCVAAGCSGGYGDEMEGELAGDVAQALPAGCSALDQSVITHVCTHPPNGPYQTINGRANPLESIIADHYYVTLNFTTDLSSPFEGSALYSVSATDDYAIHYEPSSGTTVTVREAGGAVVSPVLSGTNTTCSPALQAYKIYPLSSAAGKNPHTITFSRTATPKTAHLVVERLSPQSLFWYTDADSDTWGNPATEIMTYCTPPGTHTVNRGFDCDDSNASIYPGQGC